MAENIAMTKYVTTQKEVAHTHDFIEIEYVWSGKGIQYIDGIAYPVERGDFVLINFQAVHAYEPMEEMGMINCLISPSLIASELVNSENALDILSLNAFKEFSTEVHTILPQIRFAGRERMELEAMIYWMLDEFEGKQPGYMTILKGYVNVLLTKIFRTIRQADRSHVYQDIHKIAPQVLQYIEDNYDRKLTLKELAETGFYNPSYFSKIFKECFGKTLTEYINERRLKAAIMLIEQTDDTIQSILYQVGYQDKKHFYKLFKTYTGMTPDKYRQNCRCY